MDLKEQCRVNWARESAAYGENIRKNDLSKKNHEIWKQLIAGNLPEKSKKEPLRILDVGTGPGFFAIIMAELGHQVTAVDCTREMLQEAEKHAKDHGVTVTFLQEDCENLSFAAGSFDAIISRNVTWTLLEAERTYAKWLELLSPGGKILIFDANWNYGYHNEKYRKLRERDMEQFQEIFHRKAEEFTNEQEEYRKNMPMCKVKRPEWDLNVLSHMKIQSLHCEYDITDLVWDEERKVKYHSTPMFMIAVEKML